MPSECVLGLNVIEIYATFRLLFILEHLYLWVFGNSGLSIFPITTRFLVWAILLSYTMGSHGNCNKALYNTFMKRKMFWSNEIIFIVL